MLLGLGALGMGGGAQAVDINGNLSVSLTINSGCILSSVNGIIFPAQLVLASDVVQTGTIVVQCTPSQAYTIALGAGNGTGASDSTTNGRFLSVGGAGAGTQIAYGLYKDSGHTTTWTNTGTGRQGGTGNGQTQSYTVYGLVPAVSSSPAAGTYTDTVVVTLNY